MNCIALMLLLGVMGTAWCKPTCNTIREGCIPTTEDPRMDTKHVFQELSSTSVAPWEITNDTDYNREPAVILKAKCEKCRVDNMIAKPILYQIPVYEKMRDGTSFSWCKCPFEVAVGCTCVEDVQKS